MTTEPTTGATPSSAAGQHSTGEHGAGQRGTARDVSPRNTDAVLVTEHGTTSIADVVVTKIAGIAAREVSGVYRLGGGTARAFGAVRERIPGGRPNIGQGVSVEVGERQAAIDIDVMVEYGVAITDLSQAIRRNVITAIERMTGLEVTEVNITVDDIHLPGEDEDDTTESRAARVQ